VTVRKPVRDCDALAAPLVHRGIAAVVDFSLVALAVGLLVAGVYFSPAAEVLTPRTLPYVAGLAFALAAGYKMLYAVAGTDSPGMRWSQLRLLNFDGLPATREERISRVAAGTLSVAAAGLGVLWALVDEETLSWHDHISKTFVSSADSK
jgi:uncharacterized RDD family membrane protein YckC